jgi:hypothetical protein
MILFPSIVAERLFERFHAAAGTDITRLLLGYEIFAMASFTPS